MGFLIGLVFGLVVTTVAATGIMHGVLYDNVEKSCQGTPWVIEEHLIKKTLTCVVELKEKK